jgi:hypothetical protein
VNTNTPAPNAAYLNQIQIAEWLGRTPRFVAKLVKARKIPEIRLSGKARLYDTVKVRAALERFEIKAVGE